MRRTLCVLALSIATLLPLATHAGDAATTPDGSPDEAHRLGLGLQIGYGLGVVTRDRQRGRDVADVRFVALDPHLRMRLASPGSGEGFFQGDLDGLLEGTVLIETEPRGGGYAGGVNALLRYRFLRGHRLRPYAVAGIGIGDLQFDLVDQANGLAFFLQAGAGLRWRLDERFSLVGSVSWHHISNAQTKQPNNGIDDVLFQLGIELW